MSSKVLTVTEAAERAGRSRATVHRWVNEGWLKLSYKPTAPNQPFLIDAEHFERQLPDLLEEMTLRKGGRGKRLTDGQGKART